MPEALFGSEPFSVLDNEQPFNHVNGAIADASEFGHLEVVNSFNEKKRANTLESTPSVGARTDPICARRLLRQDGDDKSFGETP